MSSIPSSYAEAMRIMGCGQDSLPIERDRFLEERMQILDTIRNRHIWSTVLGQHLQNLAAYDTLCDACQNLPGRIASLEALQLSAGYLGVKDEEFTHLANARTWISTAQKCRICALLLYCVECTLSKSSAAALSESTFRDAPLRICPIFEDPKLWPAITPLNSNRLIGLHIVVPWTSLGGTEDEDPSVEHRKPVVMVNTVSEDCATQPKAKSGSQSHTEYVKRDETFNWLSARMDSCRNHHEEREDLLDARTQNWFRAKRKPSSYSPLPTRTIFIEADRSEQGFSCRLVEYADKHAPYVALSHCWGAVRDHPPKTTKESYSKHKVSINFETLPQTFRDAILATRRLGFQHLWIDSLCIIQNDADDWEDQARSMGLVHSNAQVVIAASHAENASQGLFLPRDSSPWITMSLAPQNTVPTKGPIQLAVPDYTYAMRCDPSTGPLSKRAWTFQEQGVVKRVIWFTNGEIVWQCRKTSLSETGLVLRDINWHDKYSDWLWIIHEYSGRRVTYVKDRLRAIQGLIDMLRHRNMYAKPDSGVWIGYPPEEVGLGRYSNGQAYWYHQLMWHRRSTGSPWSSEEVQQLQRAFLPSWSWASFPGAVKFMQSMRPATDQTKFYFYPRAKIECNPPGVLKVTEALMWPLSSHAWNAKHPTGRPAKNKDDAVGRERFKDPSIDPSSGTQSPKGKGEMSDPVSSDDFKHFFDGVRRQNPRILERDDAHGFNVLGMSSLDGKRKICGWAVLDEDGTAGDLAKDEDGMYWAIPIMTWTLSTSTTILFHQILILRKQHGGEHKSEKALLRMSDKNMDRSQDLKKRWKSTRIDAGDKFSEVRDRVLNHVDLRKRAGTYRRVGCGVLTAEAGRGTKDDRQADIYIA